MEESAQGSTLESGGRKPKRGPLVGVRIVEFLGLGPAPFACMLLADMGADVVCVTRPGAGPKDRLTIDTRGRRWVELDLKSRQAAAKALDLMAAADVVVEGFRPGVMERLGLGPEPALVRNPRLVYGRMTGWGQEGPLAQTAGHDIAYIAITGALDSIREAGRGPVPPLNLVGDYGGGALYLVAGVLAALIEAGRSGRGQVVDAAICDGAASMMSFFYSYAARGLWSRPPGENLLDGGAPFYAAYECKDGRYLAVGALEPQFYERLRAIAGLDDPAFGDPCDPACWGELKGKAAQVFKTRTRDEWAAAFAGGDACVAPVLSLLEAPDHPHLKAREVFIDRHGLRQPAPAPRFSRTPSLAGEVELEPQEAGSIVAEWSRPRPPGKDRELPNRPPGA